jgi:hypothetical protein
LTYLGYRKLAYDTFNPPKGDRFRQREKVFKTRLWMGLLALLGLCVALAFVLLESPLKGQEVAGGGLVGRGDQYFCIRIAFEGVQENLSLASSLAKPEKPDSQSHITAQCDGGHVDAHLEDSGLHFSCSQSRLKAGCGQNCPPHKSSYGCQSIASRTMLRSGTPVGPLARNGLPSSSQAVPAISRCTHGVGSANSFKNIAAVTAPP